MTIQVIRGDIEQHRHVRMKPVNRLQLKTRQFSDDVLKGSRCLRVHACALAYDQSGVRQRRPQVSADKRRGPAFLQKRSDQRNDRALAIRSGDSDDWDGQEPRGQFHLADHGNTLPPYGVEHIQDRGHTRTHDHQVNAFQPLRKSFPTEWVNALDAGGFHGPVRFRFVIDQCDVGSERDQQPRRGHPALARPDHSHGLPGKLGGLGPWIRAMRPSRHFLHCHRHRVNAVLRY